MITRFLIKLLRGYKRYISPHLGHHCRFVPTCSEYAMQALATHGLLKGLLLTVWSRYLPVRHPVPQTCDLARA